MLLIVLFTAFASLTASTTAPLNYTVCDAYLALENKTHCGPNGYALHFGNPNCRKFIDNEYEFTAAGKTFLHCVRTCLADFVTVNITAANVTNCTAITNMAYASHVPCYDKCKFCSVVLANLEPFVATFKVTDFLSEIAIHQVLQVAFKCLLDPLSFFGGIFSGIAIFIPSI